MIAVAYEALRHLVLLVAPVLPESAREIWRQMGLAGDPLEINPNTAVWGEALDMSQVENSARHSRNSTRKRSCQR